MIEPIKNILICLDHTETDHDLLTFARFIINSAKTVEKVTTVNILKSLNVPSEILKEFPDLRKNAVSERINDLTNIMEEHLGDKEVQKEVMVNTGSALKNILKVIEEKSIDLVLIGKKARANGTGVLTQRMGRRCPVTLLIVPSGSTHKISDREAKHNVLVPIDFSEYSYLAIERAVEVAKNYTNTEIFAQHVYHVPVGYHYAGKSKEEFAEIMKLNAQKQFKKFIAKCDCNNLKINEEYTLDDNENIVEDIHNFAKKINATGIVFGSKGMTTASSYFLGSTAEKLIKIDTEFPLMVVRRAGEYKGIMHLIQKL
jgi:nucleotide-binding universal stress UspA family protein